MRVIRALLALMALGLAATGVYYSHLKTYFETEKILNQPFEFEFSRGMRLESLCSVLESKIEISCLDFRLSIRMFSDFRRFQAGHYRIEGSFSPQSLAQTLSSGRTYRPVIFSITVPEGFTLAQIAQRLEDGGIASKSDSLNLARQRGNLNRWRLPKGAYSAEGFLYPATYQFYEKPTAEEVLETMVAEFWKRLPKDFESNLKEQNLSLFQAVSFASLIQAETRFDEERSLISKVIWTRLKTGMALGIDAAVIYGIPNYRGDIKSKDLKNKENPYNLRIHRGLPPGPICNPDVASLLAVLTPSSEPVLYYVLRDDDSGKHSFSKNAKEHQRAVDRYLKYYRSKYR